MIHTYTLTGMTCGSCESKVKSNLLDIKGVDDVAVSKDDNTAIITMANHIPLTALQGQLGQLGDKYSISVPVGSEEVLAPTSWIETYKPVLLIFLYIFTVTGLIEYISDGLQVERWMRHFMAGFFLTFSFFKMLNLQGFKESYQMYDIVARRYPNWGYIYAFTELALGIALLINYNPIITYTVTIVVMSVSIIGVLQTVLNKKTIKCACLGDVFNLPMSTVTIIEDGLMILMSIGMLLFQL